MLDRPTKLFIAIATLTASLFLVMNHIKDAAPVEDWLLAGFLALLSGGFWVWMWLEDRPEPETSALTVSDAATAVPSVPVVREWDIPPAPGAALPPADEPRVDTPGGPDLEADERAEVIEEVAEAGDEAEVVQAARNGEPDAEQIVAEAMAAPPVGESKAADATLEPDDLTRIEGIGPKYSAALIAAGIDTFQKLADASDAEIEEAVTGAAMLRRPASMNTWNEQATYAAKGDWDGLQELQDKLEGGRRTE